MDTEAFRRLGREVGEEVAAQPNRRHDARHVLSDYDVDTLDLNRRPQIRYPLRDPTEVIRHLKVTIADFTALVLTLERMRENDKSSLLLARAAIKRVNQKVNAKTRL